MQPERVKIAREESFIAGSKRYQTGQSFTDQRAQIALQKFFQPASSEASDAVSPARELNAYVRSRTGSNISAHLRGFGRTPAVIYGGSQPEILISVNTLDLLALMRQTKAHFYNQVFRLNIYGTSAFEYVIPRMVDMDPVTFELNSLTFLRYTPGQPIAVEFPLQCINEDDCVGVKNGGAFIQLMFKIPCHFVGGLGMPKQLTHDLTPVDIGKPVFVRDLKLPAGVRPIPKIFHRPAVIVQNASE